MDIIEFIEKVYGIELWDYQKETIKAVADLPEGSTIVMGRNGPVILDKDGKRIRPKRKEQTRVVEYGGDRGIRRKDGCEIERSLI